MILAESQPPNKSLLLLLGITAIPYFDKSLHGYFKGEFMFISEFLSPLLTDPV